MKKLSAFWLLSLLVKLILAYFLPMTTDETYYWVWSLHPQLSYFDHPPAVAWLFSLGNFFQSYGNAVRWPSVFVGHLTIIVWYFIWKDFISVKLEKFSWWFYLAIFTPLIGFGSVIATPDVPVLLFWSLSIYYFLNIIKNEHWANYLFLGISLGLGFCSKYHIVLFPILAMGYLIAEKKWNIFRWKKILILLLSGFIFSLPVVIWNFQNDFMSFTFQLKHGLAKEGYEFYWTWSYVIAQCLVIFPIIVWAGLKKLENDHLKPLFYFAWGPLIFFFLTSFKGLVEVNWPIIAYPSFFAVAVLNSKNIKPIVISSLFWMTLFLVLISHLLFPWIPNAPEKIDEFSQFEPLLPAIEQHQPFFGSTYQMASWLWYKTKNPVYKLKGMSRFDIFDTFQGSLPTSLPIYIGMKVNTSLPLWIEKSGYKISLVASLEKDLVIIKVEEP